MAFLRNQAEDPSPTQPPPSQQPEPKVGPRVDGALLIRDALKMAQGGRNDAGIWLACQLRDNGYARADAKAAMGRLQCPLPETW